MKTIAIKELLPVVTPLGRTLYNDKEGVLYTDWTCAGIEFCWQGSLLQVELAAEYNWEIMGAPWDPEAPKRPNWPWFAVFCDDMDTPVQAFAVEEHRMVRTILEGADPTVKHLIRIVKRTENYKTWGGIVSVTTDGSVSPAPAYEGKTIEFIGDSITCGFGNGTIERDGPFYSEEENGLINHGTLAAKALGMRANFISVSGIVVTRNESFPMEYDMEEIYDFTDKPGQRHMTDGKQEIHMADEELETWDFAGNPRDYVVLNLGTNDATGIVFSADKKAATENFRTGYARFIRNLRAKNGPKTRIICALGTMNYYLYHDICQIVEAYQAETGDSDIYTFRYMTPHPMDGLGACGHPSAVTHEKMAAELAEFIRSLE